MKEATRKSRTPEIGPQKRAMAVVSELDDLWSVHECAKYLCLTESSLYALVSRREVPFFRLTEKKGIRFRPREIMEWVETRHVDPVQIKRLAR